MPDAPLPRYCGVFASCFAPVPNWPSRPLPQVMIAPLVCMTERVVATGRHGRPVGSHSDPHRHVAVGVAADAKLTERVVPPGPQRAVGPDREHMVCACRHGHPGGDRTYPNRRPMVRRGAVTKLAHVVPAPRPQRAVGLQGKRELPARRDGYPTDVRADAHGADLRVGAGAVAHLAHLVTTPRPQRAVGGDGQHMTVTGRHGDPSLGALLFARGSCGRSCCRRRVGLHR